MKLSELKLYSNRQSDGIWKKVFPEMPFEVCVTSLRSVAYQKGLAKLMAPHERKARNRPVSNSIQELCVMQAVCRFALVDWRNLTDDEGTPIKFSSKLAESLMIDDGCATPFGNKIVAVVAEVTEEQDALVTEQDEGNF